MFQKLSLNHTKRPVIVATGRGSRLLLEGGGGGDFEIIPLNPGALCHKQHGKTLKTESIKLKSILIFSLFL